MGEAIEAHDRNGTEKPATAAIGDPTSARPPRQVEHPVFVRDFKVGFRTCGSRSRSHQRRLRGAVRRKLNKIDAAASPTLLDNQKLRRSSTAVEIEAQELRCARPSTRAAPAVVVMASDRLRHNLKVIARQDGLHRDARDR